MECKGNIEPQLLREPAQQLHMPAAPNSTSFSFDSVMQSRNRSKTFKEKIIVVGIICKISQMCNNLLLWFLIWCLLKLCHQFLQVLFPWSTVLASALFLPLFIGEHPRSRGIGNPVTFKLWPTRLQFFGLARVLVQNCFHINLIYPPVHSYNDIFCIYGDITGYQQNWRYRTSSDS